jgi:hypothetical protein
MPYSSYEKFQFNVPISTDGDCWARYEVRLVEMRESVKIIQQALDGMPEGPVKADAPKIVLPDREKMKTQMEALIHHFKIVTEGFEVPAGEVYQGIECGHGQMGYYVVSDGTAKPYRVHMRYPSFATLQALETMCKGRMLADLVAVIGSIDIVLGEIRPLSPPRQGSLIGSVVGQSSDAWVSPELRSSEPHQPRGVSLGFPAPQLHRGARTERNRQATVELGEKNSGAARRKWLRLERKRTQS